MRTCPTAPTWNGTERNPSLVANARLTATPHSASLGSYSSLHLHVSIAGALRVDSEKRLHSSKQFPNVHINPKSTVRSMASDDLKLLVCTGKDCRKYKKFMKLLANQTGSELSIEEVRCQKICNPMVVGFTHEDILYWARKLQSKKDAKALISMVEKGKMTPRLKSKLVKKRQNRLRD